METEGVTMITMRRNDDGNGRIILHSGELFDLMRPERSRFEISDIAHSLSNQCRFGGHTPFFYSVAQHSVLVSDLLPPELRLAGLLHDAAEAYIGDLTAPLKHLLPEYLAIEQSIERALFSAFGIDYPLHPDIKCADQRVLAAELRDLFKVMGNVSGVLPLPDKIDPLDPLLAEALFLDRFCDLTGA